MAWKDIFVRRLRGTREDGSGKDPCCQCQRGTITCVYFNGPQECSCCLLFSLIQTATEADWHLPE